MYATVWTSSWRDVCHACLSLLKISDAAKPLDPPLEALAVGTKLTDDYTTGADRYYYYSKVSFGLSTVFRTVHGPDDKSYARP